MEKTKREDVQYPPEIFKYDNMTVRVYYPIISDEENERRMKRIHDSAANLLKEQIENRIKQERAEQTK